MDRRVEAFLAGRGPRFEQSSSMAARATYIVTMSFVGFLLAVPHAAIAQGLAEAAALTHQVDELKSQGGYSEAVPLAQRALAIQEKALGPNHPDVAQSLNSLATLYLELARYANAEPLFKRSLKIYEMVYGLDHPTVALVLNNLAQVYKRQGRYADAEPLLKRSFEIQTKTVGPSHPDTAISLNNLAELYNAQGRYSEAEPLLKQSLAINEKAFGPNHASVATSLNNLADLYETQGRYSEAEPLLKRSLAIREKAFGPNHPIVAQSLNNLADLYVAQGHYADAGPLLQRALKILEAAQGSNHPNFAVLLNNLAEVYRAQGRYADAEPLYKRSIALSEKVLGPDHPQVAPLLHNLAQIYVIQGRYTDAEPLYKRYLAISNNALGPDHPDVARALNNLGEIYRVQGRYADAESLFNRALTIMEKAFGPNHPDVAHTLFDLAELYRIQGRYVDAESLYKRSLAIRESAGGPDHPDVGPSLNGLASLYETEGRYVDAESLYKRFLAIAEKARGPDHPDVATALGNLALLYETEGRYIDAEPLFKRSLAISEKTLDHLNFATSLNNLADLYSLQRRYAEAEPMFNRSLAIKEKLFGPDHPSVADVFNSLGRLYRDQGRYTDTEPLLKRALRIYNQSFGPEHPASVRALNNLAVLYKDEGRYNDALPIVQSLITQNHAAKFIALNVLYESRSQKLIAPTDALESSYIVIQHSFSSAAGNAVSQLAARFAAGTNELAQLVRKDQDLTAEADRLDQNIITAVSKSPAERNATTELQIRRRIEEIKLERDQLQSVFNQRFPDYAALSKPPPLSIEETQALLADDEALIVFDFDATSHVWVISKDQAEWKQLSVSANEVSKEVMALRSELDPGSFKPFDAALAYTLYEQILGPVRDFISHKSRLSFVLSGALTSLPPQVLITNDPEGKDLASASWLVREHAITVLPSTTSLKVLRGGKNVVAAAEPLIGFGNPVFERTSQTTANSRIASLDRSLPEFYRGVIPDTKSLADALPPLPETADELRAVAKDLGARPEDIKLGESASVTNVKHLPLDKYRVVYFATHALVAGEVERFAKTKAEPALVLSIPEKPFEEDDGLLRASDVAMLKMNADFVVLSACNTAAGDRPGAEALSGLARAFFYAGARSLIVSNWEVDSDGTVALMTGLFDALKTNSHLSHAEALRLSMLRMINNPSKPEWAQPKYWAPFIVVGEPEKR